MAERHYQTVQKEAFGTLVREGIYSTDFEHPPVARELFARVMREVLEGRPGEGPLALLDCGCGPGAWLAFSREIATSLGRTVDCYGFDITPEMVDVAAARVPQAVLQKGDILAPAAYEFADGRRRFDIVYAYDVVQQLPRARQLQACREMLGHVGDGGTLILFDHDARSRFGRLMGFKKFVTRYLGVPLVPRYYCNARYPALGKLAQTLQRSGCETGIRYASDMRKRALLVTRPAQVAGTKE